MKQWTVYCHTHVESGRRYIGLTSRTMERRWNEHVSKSSGSKGGRWHFPNAIRKYGKEAFSHQILEVCSSLEEANEAEDAWIESFSTRNPQFGFNLANGGEHVPHPIRKNPWNDPEYRAKQSENLKRITQTPQARANNKAALNTPESKARRSAISIEIRSRPEVMKIMSEFSKRPHSHEHIEKIRQAHKTKALQKTHIVCKKHGVIPVAECYPANVNGWPQYKCRLCRRDHKARHRSNAANLRDAG